jgi:hypothetical protein
MVVGFTTTYAISAYHQKGCEFRSHSWRGVYDTTLCSKVCQWLSMGRVVCSGTNLIQLQYCLQYVKVLIILNKQCIRYHEVT